MIFAGPCSLPHDPKQAVALARACKEAGADVFRCKFLVGGSFPPPGGTTDPLWGPREAAAECLREISGFMPVACELRAPSLPLVQRWPFVSYWWIPARQMQNYDFVRDAAVLCMNVEDNVSTDYNAKWVSRYPTLIIKRAPYARLRDVEGIVRHVEDVGYPLDRLWVCERGIMTFDHGGEGPAPSWPADFDPMFISDFRKRFPQVRVMADISHATGDAGRVRYAAHLAGASLADAIMVECYDPPEASATDTALAVSPDALRRLGLEYSAIRDYAKAFTGFVSLNMASTSARNTGTSATTTNSTRSVS